MVQIGLRIFALNFNPKIMENFNLFEISKIYDADQFSKIKIIKIFE